MSAKNLEITPEFPIAGGRLDFLISGVLSTGKIISACVEFKHAHSNDLLRGLLKQLPAYTQAKGSDYGIYGVLFFKGPYFPEPSGYDKHSLEFFLRGEQLAAGYGNIRELILDFLIHKVAKQALVRQVGRPTMPCTRLCSAALRKAGERRRSASSTARKGQKWRQRRSAGNVLYSKKIACPP
jgi:hypothetical protein